MDNTINTNANKVEYYEYSNAARYVTDAVRGILSDTLITVEVIDKVHNLLTVARVLLISSDIEFANHMSELNARKEAEKAKAEKELKEISEAFGA